ncbi:MAG: hypothetical protein H6867_06095 [Rhodospirillales bacterium]|nr:hypothetical protein [Rhodospirillales bacterium]MCB9995100.1 hypothetical protein [Rhodospirillales bacterium]
MNKLIEMLREIFGSAVEDSTRHVEQKTMLDLTAGLGATTDLFHKMEEKGWTITECAAPVIMPSVNTGILLRGADEASIYVYFNAEKDGQKQGSISWYRDLCDVLGYDRSSIPDRDVREAGISFGGFSL